MVWCCFGSRRKWSSRIWSPDGAAYITEVSPTFSTTSLIPPANPQETGVLQRIFFGIVTETQYDRRISSASGSTGVVQPGHPHQPMVERAATFPSSVHAAQPEPLRAPPLPRRIGTPTPSPTHLSNSTILTRDLNNHCHDNRRRLHRRMSADLPARSRTPVETDIASTSRARLRPRPLSVPAANELEMAQANFNSPYGGGRASNSRFMSSMNLSSSVGGRLRQATRSVNNLHEAAAQSSGTYDRWSTRFNDAINQIDHEIFSGGEYGYDPNTEYSGPQRAAGPVTAMRNLGKAASGSSMPQPSFSKVWLYANSRLPPYLPPLKIYMPTYPLLCLAARYSLRVYDRPVGKEKDDHIKGSIFHKTKAMTLKSVPIDDMNTIVFAIRGTSSFIDWAVNFRPAPSSPEGFLDDTGNLVHAGFLDVAKGMLKPVAARLRTLLAENPSRSTCSLLITGHSAGGAVAQLLYAHMLSNVDSELSYLTGFFKRVHCVTFGTPPVSLLPLTTPRSLQNRKSLFFSFVNEGDPVARADPAIVRSLLKLYASSSPSSTTNNQQSRPIFKWNRPSTWAAESYSQGPIWTVPNATLSMGGRVIVLRPKYDGTGPDDIEAITANDELLRDAVFGDPACHTMTMYSKRIEILATRAVTVGAFS